jgi:hypothetical protein
MSRLGAHTIGGWSSAVLAVGLLALASPAAAAPPNRGGGGGPHFGGGGAPHIGGGGGAPHFGGGGGMPHFGGGAPRFGGGGMPRPGGGGMPHFGGGGTPRFGGGALHFGGARAPHVAAPHISAPRVSAPHMGHAPSLGRFTRPTFHGGGRSFAHGGGARIHGPTARSFARPAFHGNRSIAGQHGRTIAAPRGRTITGPHGRAVAGVGGHTAAGLRGAPKWTGANRPGSLAHFAGQHRFANPRTTGALAATAAGAGLIAHSNHDWARSRHEWRRHRGFFGWAGPVFWPYAYADLFDDVYWGWDYGPYYEAPFWAYGYDDIYAGLFSPYPYDDLAGWEPSYARAPRGIGSTRSASVGVGRSSGGGAARNAQWRPMCGEDTNELPSLPVDKIQNAIQPNDQQRAALDALANATAQAAQIIKDACPTEIAFTPTGRLQDMERRLQALAQAIETIREPLDNFYDLLSDEQKARFNAIAAQERQGQDQERSLTQGCGNAPIPAWPQAQIERSVHPNESQRASLDKLKQATEQAADLLKASCPSEPPATPPARLAAAANRVDTLLTAVRHVETALNEFYGSLSDEQKAQFNAIRPVRSAQGG